jgi:hypothetical protein
MTTNKEEMSIQVTELTGKPIRQSREEIDFSIKRANVLIELSGLAF